MRIYSSAYRFGAVVLSVCLFAGCLGHVPTVPTPKGSEEGEPVHLDTGRQPVRFSVSVVDSAADSLETKSQFRSDSLSVTEYELEGILFDAVVPADSIATKAAPVTSVYDTFGAFGYVYDGSWRPGLFPNLLCNERYSKSSGEWAASKQFYWPGADSRRVRFYGYSPYVVPGLQVLTTADDTGAPVFIFTCPDGVDIQTDLLIGQGARDYAGSTNGAATIEFRHVLSALTFRMGEVATPGTLKSVTLHGIYTEADFDCETMEWINHRAAGDYTVSPGVTLSGAQGETVTEGANTLMLIPQTFPEGATMEIVFNYEGVDLHATTSVAGRTLNAARTRVYELEIPTIGEHIDITGDSFDWTAAPNGASFSMKVGRSWTAVPSDPWITVNETSGERGVKTVTFSVTGNKEVGVPRTGTIRVLLDGSSVAGTVTVRQEGDVLVKTEYSAVTIDSFSYDVQDAAVHTAVMPALAYQQTQTDTYLSGNIVHTTLTSGATLAFSFPAKTGFTLSSASTGAVDVAVNPQGAERSVSVKVNVTMNGKSKEATAVLKQSADAKTGGVTYVIADISASPSSIGADGGESTVSGGAGTSTWDWISQTQTTESFTASRAVTSPASISGTTVTVPANTGGAKTFTVTYSYPEAESKTCVISQDGDSISYYDAPTGLSISSGDIAASGGTVSTATISGTCSQVAHYVSGRTETINPTYSTSWSTAVSGSDLGTTPVARTKKGTLTLTYTANGKSSTTSCDIYQAQNMIESYSDVTVTAFTYGNTAPTASEGSTDVSSITYKQTATWTSTKTSSITSGGSISYSGSATGFTLTASNGHLAWSANQGSARSITVTASVTLNSKTGTKTCTVTQDGDSVKNAHYNDHVTAYGTPTISIGSGITAGGGSATVTASVSNTWQDQTLYVSGRVVDNTARSVAGTVTLSEVSGTDNNNRYSLSGTTLSHSNMTTNETTDKVTIRATNKDSTGKYKDAEASVTNSKSASYSIGDISASPGTVGAGGGTASISGGAGTITYTYTSGSKTTGSFTANKAVTSPASISGTTVTVPANTGSARSFTVTYSYSGATSKTCTVSQNGDSVSNAHYNDHVTAYGTPTISIGSGISAGGGSATVTASVSNTWQDQTLYVSGRVVDNAARSVAGTVNLAITVNGNSRFSLSGTTLSHSNMTTNETTDNVTVTATNQGDSSKKATASTSVTNSLGSQHYKNTSGTTGDNVSSSSSIIAYGTPTVSIGSGISASGGSATVTASVTNTQRTTTTTSWYQRYTSGSYTTQKSSSSSSDNNVAGTVNLAITVNGNSRFSLSGTTLSHSNMTTNETTDNVTVTASNKGDSSKKATASTSVTNSLGTQHYKNTSGTTGDNVNTSSSIIAYGTPSASIGSGLSAAGGSATVSGSVSNTQRTTTTTTWYQRYSSGSYTAQQSSSSSSDSSVAGSVSWDIVSNGNSRFGKSGWTLTHSSMTTNVTTDYVTVRVFNADNTGYYADASTSVSNSITSTAYSIGDISASPASIGAAGGSSTISGGAGSISYSYSSGSSGSGTFTPSKTVNNGASISGSTVTIPKNTETSAKTYTVTYSYSGATSKTCTITQEGKKDLSVNYLKIYLNKCSISADNFYFPSGFIEADSNVASDVTVTVYMFMPDMEIVEYTFTIPRGSSTNEKLFKSRYGYSEISGVETVEIDPSEDDTYNYQYTVL